MGEKITKCLICGKSLVKGQTKFCCQEHFNEYKYQQNIQNWLSGKDEGWSGTGIKKFIRRYLLEKADYKCEECGWDKINPVTGNSPLEVHHKDGNYKNNKLENLQILCPNCHSLTDTYKSLNKDSERVRIQYTGRKKQVQNYCIDCGTPIFETSTRCHECEAKRRAVPLEDMPISREELKQLIRTLPFTTIGTQYGVSDNAIRKWCDKFNLPRKKTEINNYSNEEWELI